MPSRWHRFGSLCLFSNISFAALVPFFWLQRQTLEAIWMAARHGFSCLCRGVYAKSRQAASISSTRRGSGDDGVHGLPWIPAASIPWSTGPADEMCMCHLSTPNGWKDASNAFKRGRRCLDLRFLRSLRSLLRLGMTDFQGVLEGMATRSAPAQGGQRLWRSSPYCALRCLLCCSLAGLCRSRILLGPMLQAARALRGSGLFRATLCVASPGHGCNFVGTGFLTSSGPIRSFSLSLTAEA